MGSYITGRVEEAPPSLVEEPLRVIVDGLHDLSPVQTLHSFSVLDITRAKSERDGDRERWYSTLYVPCNV